MIIREKYLSKIIPFYDVDLIKVITGIRCCDKSVILTQIIDEIKNNNIDDNYHKYVITVDKINQSKNEIIHKNIIQWLLGN